MNVGLLKVCNVLATYCITLCEVYNVTIYITNCLYTICFNFTLLYRIFPNEEAIDMILKAEV